MSSHAVCDRVVRELARRCDGPLLTHVSSAGLVTFRTGGPLAALVEPKTPSSALSLWTFCCKEGLPSLVLGKGSNLLVADTGFEGIAFRMTRLRGMKGAGRCGIEINAGMALPTIAQRLGDLGQSGGEFMIGIPGTAGGALCMNAGCFGQEIGSLVEEITSATPDGEIRVRQVKECEFGMRSSVFQRESELILGARLTLCTGDRDRIRSRMRHYTALRRSQQPLSFPNSGSVFKNPGQGAAWRFIADAGLRGHWCGGAQISEKHSNFIINRRQARASDIVALIRTVQARVHRLFGVYLEMELVLAGDVAADARTVPPMSTQRPASEAAPRFTRTYGAD